MRNSFLLLCGVFVVLFTSGQLLFSGYSDRYLQSAPLAPEPEELFPEWNTVFSILSRDVTSSFQRDEQGGVSKLITHVGTEKREAKRVPSCR